MKLSNIEEKAIGSLSTKEYVEINTLLDVCFLDFLNSLDLDDDRSVESQAFANEFQEIVSKELPNASKIAVSAMALEHAEGYNNQ